MGSFFSVETLKMFSIARFGSNFLLTKVWHGIIVHFALFEFGRGEGREAVLAQVGYDNFLNALQVIEGKGYKTYQAVTWLNGFILSLTIIIYRFVDKASITMIQEQVVSYNTKFIIIVISPQC